MMHDAIIVLGYNNDPEDKVFQARIKKTAELYHQGYAPQIILSGCCSLSLDIQPRVTEAQAMFDYALDLDVPGQVMLLEEDAVDTLGNFYYAKTKFLLDCAWYNIGFVSTPGHVSRAQWLAEKVLCPEFEITGYESGIPEDWTSDGINMSETYNQQLLKKAKQDLESIASGDHDSIQAFLGTAPRKAGN